MVLLAKSMKHLLCQTRRVNLVGTTAYGLSYDRDLSASASLLQRAVGQWAKKIMEKIDCDGA